MSDQGLRSGESRDEDSPHESSQTDGVGRILRSDGGATKAPFRTTAEVQETRWDRYRNRFDIYVKTPVSIIRDDWRAIVGFAIVGIYLIMGTILSSIIEPTSTAEGPQYVQPFQTLEFPLGTDQLGQDLFAQTVHSTGPILVMMAAGAVFTVVLGLFFGLVSGYKGGTIDTIFSSITDVFINIPGLPLVIVLSILFEPRDPILIGILLSVAAWAGLARAIRSQVLTIRNESFTEASRAMDISTPTILTKEILPHLMPYVMVNFVNSARNILFSAVALYYLGVLPFSSSNWGIMLNQAYNSGAVYRPHAVHWLLIPMVAIAGISIGLILIAQSLDRVFNPRARARHAGPAPDENEDVEVDSTGLL